MAWSVKPYVSIIRKRVHSPQNHREMQRFSEAPFNILLRVMHLLVFSLTFNSAILRPPMLAT